MIVYVLRSKEKILFVYFGKQKSIRSALYAQSRTVRESTNTDTTLNETHVFDMRGEINSAPLTKYLDSGINEACMDQPTQTQLTQ